MAVTFTDLHTEAGLNSLNDYLSGKNYISGDQLTKDDVKVYAAVLEQPSVDLYPNSSECFPGKAVGVRIGQGAAAEAAPAVEAKIIGPYTVEARKLAMRVLDMIYEGLGLIHEDSDKWGLMLMIHHYPACPDPSSALGQVGYTDSSFITSLQEDVYGLQLLKDGQWIGVEPLPNALVINIMVIGNGKLKPAVHRVVTNSDCSRTTLASFINLPHDTIIEPTKSLVTPSNPPVYRAFPFKEYLEVLSSKNYDTEATAEYFKIKS